MLPPIQKHFETLEKQRSAWLARLGAMDQARLRARAADGGWSALEITDHLVKTESGIFEGVLKIMPNGPELSAADKVKGRGLEMLFRSPARVKVPPQASAILPGEVEGLAEVEARWDASRARMRDGLARVEDLRKGRGCFRHPVSGWMSLEQTLRFLSAHLVHHEFQVQRLEKELGNGG